MSLKSTHTVFAAHRSPWRQVISRNKTPEWCGSRRRIVAGESSQSIYL
jgi:hypothetical protein